MNPMTQSLSAPQEVREAMQQAWQWIADNETRVFAFMGPAQHGEVSGIAAKLRAALSHTQRVAPICGKQDCPNADVCEHPEHCEAVQPSPAPQEQPALGALSSATCNSITNAVMDLVDRLGSEAGDVDPRAWGHLLVYAPAALPAVQPLSEEREAFEAAWLEHAGGAKYWVDRADHHAQDDRLTYCEGRTRDAYFGWQARAIASPAAAQPAGDVAGVALGDGGQR